MVSLKDQLKGRPGLGKVLKPIHFRNLDPAIKEAFRAWCTKYGFAMSHALNELIRLCIKNEYILKVRRTKLDGPVASWYCRELSAGVVALWKGYCYKRGYNLTNGAEALMARAVTKDTQIEIRRRTDRITSSVPV